MKTFKIINLSDDTGNTEEFQISEKPMGSGRRSLCYEAMDTRRNIPRYIKKLKNNDPGAVREFGKAYKLQAELSNVTKNTVPGLIGFYCDSDGAPYIVLEKFYGSTLRNADFHSLYDFFSMVFAIVQGLREYHNAGYLMLDLSADNVYCLAEKGALSGAYFFDFDSVMTLEDAREVDAIPTSPRMSAPEVARGDFDRIGFQSDYFSLGAVVYERLFGRPPLSLLGFGNDKKYASVKCYREELMASVALREQLDQFFQNTLALSPDERYSDLDALASTVKKLCDLSHPNLQRNVRSNFYPDPGKHYVRTSQLDELKKFFLSRKDTYAVGVIHGESGCGKSTLAQAISREMEQHYDCVEWCSYDRRGFKGILEQITLVDPGKSVEEKESALKMNNQRILIVIDNFDEGMSKQALTPWGNCHIVITSRYGVESFAGLAQSETCIDVPLGSSPELGWAVFQNVYHSLSRKKLLDEQRQAVDILLGKVGYHTYASDLIARALAKDFSPSAIEYIWEEKVESRKDIQVGHGSVEATVEKHISALFTDQIRKQMRGTSKIETEILFLLSKDRLWSKELLCTLAGDDPDCGRKQAKEIINRMVSRNLLKDEGERFFGTYRGKAISVHPLVQMAIQGIFTNKRKWDEEDHLFRALYNLYSQYRDDINTEALAYSSWPEVFKEEVSERTAQKLKERKYIKSGENTLMHGVSLVHWVNQADISLEIEELLCLDSNETYYAYLITDDKTIFFAYAGERIYPFMVLQSVYPKDELSDLDELNISTLCGEVSIRNLIYGRFEQQELIIPSEICRNPVYEVIRTVRCRAKRVCFPDGFLNIGPGAFAGGFNIEEVGLPNSLMAIWDYAFFYTSVRELYIPSSVQLISDFAFSDCKDLERITIAADNIQIDFCAFEGCEKLCEVVIQGKNVTIDASAFWNCDNLKRIEATEAWKKRHIHIIEALPAYEPEDEEERRMIEEYREDMQNPINVALRWSSNDCKMNGENLDEDAFRQTIGEMLTSLGIDEIS